MNGYKINNMPASASHYEFVVVRLVGDELWYYGAYRDGFQADQVAYSVGGVIVHNVRIQGYQP